MMNSRTLARAAALCVLLLMWMAPAMAGAQAPEDGTRETTVDAAEAAVEFLLAEKRIGGPLRLGAAGLDPDVPDPEEIARSLEWFRSLASRLQVPFDDPDAFRASICDEKGKAEVGGDGCRWLNPGNPVAVQIMRRVEGERGVRIGVSAFGIHSTLSSMQGRQGTSGWGHHFTLLVTSTEEGTHEVEIVDVLYGSYAPVGS